jgi:hypothetical protein
MTEQEVTVLASNTPPPAADQARQWEPFLSRLSSNTSRNHGIVEGLSIAAEAAGDEGAAYRLRALAALAARKALQKDAEAAEARTTLESPQALDAAEEELRRIEAGLAKPNDAFEGLRHMQEHMRRRATSLPGEDAA